MRCDGCGRLLGGRKEFECVCWRAIKLGATIPPRLVTRVKMTERGQRW